MYDSKDKDSKFLEAINNAAQKSCNELAQELKEQIKKEMEKAEAEIHAECHRKMEKKLSKLQTATVGTLAKYVGEKREVLGYRRAEIEAAVFHAVNLKLAVYQTTAPYRVSMTASAVTLKPYFSDASDVVLYVCAGDMALANDLQDAFGHCQVMADPTNRLGGIRAESLSKKLCINDTFDSRLTKEKQWFAECSGLKIV